MALIEWNPSLNTGVPEIDYQHRNLVAMLNALASAIEEKTADIVLRDILDELNAYVLTHFAAEERIMERIGYEYMAEHQAEHHRLAETVQRYRDAFARGETPVQDILAFMIRWLLNHIAGADSHIGKAYQERTSAPV